MRKAPQSLAQNLRRKTNFKGSLRTKFGSPVEVVMMSKRILSRGRDSIRNITTCLGLPKIFLAILKTKFLQETWFLALNNVLLFSASSLR